MNKTVITAEKRTLVETLRSIYQYKDLFRMLAWRDIQVRYAQTYLGLAWAIINPLFTLLVLTFVFGVVSKVDTAEIPHVVFTIAGMCCWVPFATLTNESGKAIVAAKVIISKIYFPRILIPLSKILLSLVDAAIVFFFLLCLLLFHQVPISYALLLAPLFIFCALACGLATGLWVSALSVRFRDFIHISPIILRIGIFLTPIAYPAAKIPQAFLPFYFLNPMAGITEAFRWAVFGSEWPGNHAFLSFAILILLFWSGLRYFNKVESEMADYS
ncbi:MAG: ABC transporter permease [Bacteroidota bacterium]